MSRRGRASRCLVALFSSSLLALSVSTVAPVAPAKAASPPAYYAIALGMVNGVTATNAMNEAGVVAGQFDGSLARITGSTIQPLSAPGGYPFDINENGTIVGSAGTRAIRVDGTTVTPLGGIGGDYESAYDIDEPGTTIVGASSMPGGEQHAWVDDGTGATDLGTLGGDYTIASKVNDSGLIAGSARTATGDMHLVTWQGGVMTDLDNQGNYYANVIDMNEAGQIIASVGIQNDGDRALFWNGSAFVDIGTLGGTTTWPGAMNESGHVIATSRTAANVNRAAYWDGSSLHDLGTLPGGAEAYGGGINDEGQMTGTSDIGGGRQHGFLIDDGVMYDLNDLLPAHSVEITSVWRISNSGHILANSGQGFVLLVPGTRPTADYDVIDLGAGLGTVHDASPTDMNASHQATGNIDFRAFVNDGSSASFIFPPSTESGAAAINAAGEVVGTAQQGAGNAAYRYDGTVHFLGTLGGATSYARDINDAGDVVGAADDVGGSSHAFLYRGGVMTDLHTFGAGTSQASRINNSGTMIGYYSPSPGQLSGFVSDGTTTTNLGTLGGITFPGDVNESGEIVGSSGNQAFRYTNGTMTGVGPPGSISSEGIAINESGAIAGSWVDASGTRRPFKLDDGTYSLIPDMGGTFATSMDINDLGQVVGYASTTTNTRGYLFSDGALIDLTTKLPLGYEAVIQVAFKIGNDGAILARGQTADFRDRALLLVPTTPPSTSPLTIDASRPAAASVPVQGRFEKEFTLSRTYGTDSNDPAVIDVTATFTAPSGESFTVPAFFGTDYTLRPGTGIGGSELYDAVPGTESGVWHARFSPNETGTWRYTLKARDRVPGKQTTAVSSSLTFTATASAAKGQVERDPRDDRFLRYADGTPYLPMGQNIAFGDGNPFNDGSHYYEPHFQSMQAAGQNWVRVWMTDFYITAIEWSSTHFSGQYHGVGQYADVPGFRIEQILDLAEQYGLEVQLVLNDHGQFSSWVNPRWYDNPYNADKGGPVPADDPAAFFSNPTAKQLFKQRLHYLVARYGAYRDILAWELFNETQFIGSSTKNPFGSQEVRDDLVAWHAEMAAYLRSLDPYDHLITTSSDIDTTASAIWNDPNIDLVQVHDYGPLAGRDERFGGYATNLNATYGKPVIIGEFGLQGEAEAGFDPTTSGLPADRIAHLSEATHLHNSAWAAAMSGSGAMSWWWGNYIRNDASHHRTPPDFPANERVNPPLRAFFAGEDLAGMNLEPSSISAPPSVIALGLDNGSRGFAWIRDADNWYGSGVGPGDLENRTISGATIGLAGFASGSYRVEIHDSWGVDPVDDSQIATASGGTLTIGLPDFTRDVAIKVRPIGAATATEPVQVSLTSPNPGLVTIAESSTTDPPPPGSGYTFLGSQFQITAPAASTSNPLTIVFTVDQTLLASVDPDLTANTLAIFRDGVPVEACTATTADDPATPDPCVSLRETLSGGQDESDARITVLTSAASRWNVGSRPSFTAPGAPTGVTATKGNTQATVTWTPPTDDGGSSITGYTVTSSPGARTATVDGSTTTAVVTGLTNGTSYTFTVTATNSIGTGPASTPSNAVVPAAPIAQAITFPKPANSTMLQSPLTVSATASSGLPVTLTSNSTSNCTVSGLVVTFVAAGTCSLTATQPGNANYQPAAPVTRTFTISQVNQTVTFTKPPNSTMLQSPLSVTASASSNLAVALTSNSTSVCTVSGFVITFVGPGTCSITATQPGNATYRAANPITRTFTITKAAQTITFPKPPNATLIQSPTTVSATASSGLPVAVASTTPSICSVNGFSVDLLAAGTCTLRATQPGDANYAAATAISRSFTVSKASQTITLPNPGTQSMQNPSVVLNPSASSGLTVTLTSQTTAVCTVSGNSVTLLKAGTCRIRGAQPGNATYLAAPAVTISFSVTP